VRWLELGAVLAALYTMVATTPLGGWAWTWARRALGRPAEPPGLARWFTTGAPPAEGLAVRPEVLGRPPTPDAPETVEALRVGLRPALARGLLVMAARGQADAEGALDVQLPAGLAPALAGVGMTAPSTDAGAPGPLSGAARAARTALLIELTQRWRVRLGGEAPALATLRLGPAPVLAALARARARGEVEPTAWPTLARYLSGDERRRAEPWVRGALALATAYELGSPLATPARLTSGFGPRTHPVLGTRRPHTGVDLAVPTGTPLLAVGPGVVRLAREDAVNGKYVRLDHGHGLTTAYCHASALEVAAHDVVQAGQRIATSGSTGRSTGPHLHFQLELDGVPVDPLLFMATLRPSATAGAGSGAREVGAGVRELGAVDVGAVERGARGGVGAGEGEIHRKEHGRFPGGWRSAKDPRWTSVSKPWLSRFPRLVSSSRPSRRRAAWRPRSTSTASAPGAWPCRSPTRTR
jgi:murein DD-endopeptidase MepM/ murein hydrolase activator NlpD